MQTGLYINLLDVRCCLSMETGGDGMHYTCAIGRKQSYLFNEVRKGFVERRASSG